MSQHRKHILSLHLRSSLAAIAMATLVGSAASARAGTWSITSVFSGSATGTSAGNAWNDVNGNIIGSYTFPSNTTGINMNSGIHNGSVNDPANSKAYTSSAKIIYTLTWTPSGGSDPAPSTVTVALNLQRSQGAIGNTSVVSGTVSAKSDIKVDTIQFPTVQGSASGIMAYFNATPANETIKLVKVLSVSSNQATLTVNLETKTETNYTPSGGGGTTTGSTGGTATSTSTTSTSTTGGPTTVGGTTAISTAGSDGMTIMETVHGPRATPIPFVQAAGVAQINPSINVLDIVLVVPEQGVFPKLNPASDDRNKYQFNTASPGVLGNPAWTSTCMGAPASTFLPNTTYTSFDISGSTKVAGTKSASGQDIVQQFTYTTLPSSNDAFGDKDVTMTCTGPVSTTQTSHVRVFYGKTATNHPLPDQPYFGTSTPTPNWFYYWSKTDAYIAGVKYNVGSGTGLTFFDTTSGSWVATAEPGACGTAGATWGGAKGIDFFAWICRHEAKHKIDMIAWWGAGSDRVPANDPDGDYIPTTQGGSPLESTLVPAAHKANYPLETTYNPNSATSVTDDTGYGLGFRDVEDYCMHTQATWNNGSIDNKDWGHPGKQWALGGQNW